MLGVAFIAMMLMSTTFLSTISIPVATLLFPQLWGYIPIMRGPVSNEIFFLLNFIRLLPIPICCGSTSLLCLLTVITLQSKLSLMHKVIKHGQYFDLRRRREFAHLYRKIQIFTILANGYLQKYMMTGTEFFGSVIIISLLFSIASFRPMLGGVLLSLIVLSLLTLALFIFFLLDCASRPFLLSRNVVTICEKGWRSCSWSEKFLKSCQPIALRIGPFHMIDRERAPLMMRFCLQRTFFLTVGARN